MYYKILFLSKETGGGTGTVLNQIASLRKKKFKNKFYFYKKERFSTFKDKYFFVNKNYPKADNFTGKKAIIFIDNLLKTRQIILKEKPDLVFTADLYSFIISSVLKPFFKKTPLISSHHINLEKYIEDKPNRLHQNLLFYLIKALSSQPDKHIFVSQALSKALAKKFNIKKEKIVVIHNAVDLDLIEKRATVKAKGTLAGLFENKGFKILTVGRLNKQKDYSTILKAFSRLLKELPNVNLFIVSDGEMKKELIKKTKNLEIDQKVHFLGWVNNFFPLLKLSHLFVFASHYEGFGITLIEAMAMKVPVVSTNTPFGPSEILGKGKYGILVPLGDYKKMAEEMAKLLRSKSLREEYSRLGYERAKIFNINQMLKKYEDIFLQLIEES